MQEWIEKNLASSAAMRPAADLTQDDVVNVLRASLVLITDRGWVQGSGCGENDEVCSATSISGAMLSSEITPSFRYGRYQVVADAVVTHLRIEPHGFSPNDDLIEWNDEPGRTVEEVLVAFQGTIDDLASGTIRIENGKVAT